MIKTHPFLRYDQLSSQKRLYFVQVVTFQFTMMMLFCNTGSWVGKTSNQAIPT